ncbi:hypothetical protein [Siphonobacter sp. BAB-5385]|uniref:hypothetical protein n=1 Tax=Siphonobacter sp. BAB-5385 TaxID=1864822 RepID=UPI0020CCDCDA|nr:hypothetical protein [Siphonobacter sp. BAB-5385]
MKMIFSGFPSLRLICSFILLPLLVSAQSSLKTTDLATQRLQQELERMAKLAKGKVGVCACTWKVDGKFE